MSVTVNSTWNADQKKNLQKMLNNYGFTDNDGNTLSLDGVIGLKTQQALKKMNTYRQHLSKPDVETAAWQAQLNDWGYQDANGMPLKVDGIYGPKTDAATNNFENDFFDGFSGGTNQKKSEQTKSFPTMPKANDNQIVSALASNTQRADVIGPRGKSYDFTNTDVPAVNANHYNRNAGLNKSKVMDLASRSNDPSDTVDPVSHFPQDYNSWTSEQQKNADPVGTYYIGSGDKAVKGNVYAKDVTAPVTFDNKDDTDDKYRPSNYGSAGNNLDILDVCAMFDYMDYSQDERWTKNSTDCSSFVVRVYSSLGKNLAEDDGPYTTAAGMAKSLDDKGQRINKEDLQPGDLIFWSLKDAPDRYHGITHVAVFAGYKNGVPMMWEAADGGVQYVPVSKQGEPLQYARVP